MTDADRSLGDEISENRRRIGETASSFTQTYTRNFREIKFNRNVISVSITVDIYTRELQNQLVIGHPDAKHGVGRGGVGTDKSAWTLQETVSDTVFTKQGRNTVRDALDGQNNQVSAGIIGTGTTATSTSDTSLDSKAETLNTEFTFKNSGNVISRSYAKFNEHGNTSVDEVGVETATRLVARAVTDTTLNLDNNQEFRFDVTFSFSFNVGNPNAAITSNLKTTVQDAFADGDPDGLAEIALGSGSSDATSSDTGLDTNEIQKNADRTLTEEQLEAYTVVFETEPNSQPVDFTELGVFDEAGDLVYRTTFSAVTKNNELTIRPETSWRIR